MANVGRRSKRVFGDEHATEARRERRAALAGLDVAMLAYRLREHGRSAGEGAAG